MYKITKRRKSTMGAKSYLLIIKGDKSMIVKLSHYLISCGLEN